MKTRLLAALVLVTAVASASAETYDATEPLPQKDGYLGVIGGGGVSDSAFRLGVGLDGGYRIAASPWFLHGHGATGLVGVPNAGGRYTALRGGLEARRCLGFSVHVCGFAGADIGAMLDTVTTHYGAMTTSTATPMVVPRAGLEVGTQVKLRAIAEAPLYGGSAPETGINVALGLAYAF